MKIIGGMLVRNEANRWLKQVCERMKDICDLVIVIDDNSDDETPTICKDYGFHVYESVKSFWGVDELKQRKRLFNYMSSKALDGDILLIIDADEIIAEDPKAVRELLVKTPVYIGTFTFQLFDMWDDTHYRNDNLWNAHTRAWPMAVRKTDTTHYWLDQSLHCGRFPMSAYHNPMHTRCRIKHMGWSTPQDRKAKYERYMRIDPKGEMGSKEQYISILDPNPVLEEFKNDK